MKYQFNQTASIFYEGHCTDGTPIDSNYESEIPFSFQFGTLAIISGLESAIREMEVGEECVVEIPCIDAYGPYRKDAVRTIALNSMTDGGSLRIGDMIEIRGKESPVPMRATVKSIDHGVAVLDYNHPLAGKDLVYKVKLVSVL